MAVLSNPQVVEIWGDLACFTRPELKVERFSYPVMTPAAARGILEAIYWRPHFRWQVTAIEILNPPRYIALRRNEVKERANVEEVLRWADRRATPEPLWADESDPGNDRKGRTQRQTMALKDVRYRIHAEIRAWSGSSAELAAFEAQFERHLRRGQCRLQPYLGCREFAGFFAVPSNRAACPLDQDLGWMVYDVFDLAKPATRGRPGRACVSVFKATLRDGWLQVPEFESAEVRRAREARDA